MRGKNIKKSNIYSVILIALLILLAVMANYVSKNEDEIARIGRYSITKPEFYLYLYEQKLMFESKGESDIWEMSFDGEPGEKVAKQNALNSITYVRIALEYAKKSSFTQTNEDTQAALQNGQKIYENLKNVLGLPKLKELAITRELCERVSKEGKIYEDVYAFVTENYVLSDVDFEKYYEDFYIKNRSSILSNSQELKERVREYYITQKKEELLKQEYNKLLEDMQMIINDSVWDNVSIWDFDIAL